MKTPGRWSSIHSAETSSGVELLRFVSCCVIENPFRPLRPALAQWRIELPVLMPTYVVNDVLDAWLNVEPLQGGDQATPLPRL